MSQCRARLCKATANAFVLFVANEKNNASRRWGHSQTVETFNPRSAHFVSTSNSQSHCIHQINQMKME